MLNIPVYKPFLCDLEEKYVNECIKTNWISSKGKFISKFEESFSNYLGIKHSTSVSNGTVALHLALHTLGIGPNDEVILPTLTYVATANSVAYVGAKPVFVDSDRDTWNINPEKIISKITKNTKAILVVHLYGNPCSMDKIMEICEKYKLLLIEDSAESFGSTYKGRYMGNFGNISTFSFFGNKTITTGEGGMVSSSNEELVKRAAYLKSQAVSKEKEYWHDELGFNYRMTNICSAIGLAQLEKADIILQKKQRIAMWYQKFLKDCDITFQKSEKDCVNSFWMVSILMKNEKDRDNIREYLKAQGVETRPLFSPIHKMGTFKSNETFPIAESLTTKGLNLPSYPDLKEEDIFSISEIVKKYFESI